MRQPKQIYCANDNAPLRTPRLRAGPKLVKVGTSHTQISPLTAQKRTAAAVWIIPIFAIMSGAWAIWQSIALSTLVLPSLFIGIALLLNAVLTKPDSRARNISGLLMVVAFAVSLYAWLSQNGFTLIGVELALLVSSLSLLIGWIFRSKPAVLLSAFAALFYLANQYPELGLMTGISDQLSHLGSGLLPWLIFGQVVLAQKLRSFVVLFTAIAAAYIWAGTLATDFPMIISAGVSFAIAAAHYGLGKAWSEAGQFGANLHRLCAWFVGLGAVLYVQSTWLSPELGSAKPFYAPNVLWISAVGAAMATLFIASLMRYKSSHISLLGIFIIMLAVGIVPIATAKPDLVHDVFDAIPGLNAQPGLGLIIGATLIAIGCLWLIKGLRYGQILDMTMGALIIGIEAVILFQPDSLNADLGVIFVVSLICALCFGGLVAGTSPERNLDTAHYA